MVFQERYRTGNTPWEIHRPDYNLIKTVERTPIAPGRAIDIGCGTGNNTIWLQQQGFEAIGIDRTELAIARAREKAQEAGVECPFQVRDFLADDIPGASFDFAFDRGCFHHFLEYDKLDEFARKVASILVADGRWLTLTGNADETRPGPGPPQLSARLIVNAVEPYFKILSLTAKHFDTDQEVPAKNWICLLQKR
jgi:SAM-dependent methyltransferase